MTYDEALAAIAGHPRVIIVRDSDAKLRVTWRFGRPVMITIMNRFIDYTPTQEEYRATDWKVL